MPESWVILCGLLWYLERSFDNFYWLCDHRRVITAALYIFTCAGTVRGGNTECMAMLRGTLGRVPRRSCGTCANSSSGRDCCALPQRRYQEFCAAKKHICLSSDFENAPKMMVMWPFRGSRRALVVQSVDVRAKSVSNFSCRVINSIQPLLWKHSHVRGHPCKKTGHSKEMRSLVLLS